MKTAAAIVATFGDHVDGDDDGDDEHDDVDDDDDDD